MSGQQVPVGQSVLPGAAEKPRKLSKLARDTLDVVQLAARRGRADMTLVEILHALRTSAPNWSIEKSSLSRELTHLALDGLLLRRSSKRKSAWEALPVGMDQKDSLASYAYYVPGAGSGRPPAVMTAAAASAGAGRGAAPAAGADVPAGQGVGSEPDFY